MRRVLLKFKAQRHWADVVHELTQHTGCLEHFFCRHDFSNRLGVILGEWSSAVVLTVSTQGSRYPLQGQQSRSYEMLLARDSKPYLATIRVVSNSENALGSDVDIRISIRMINIVRNSEISETDRRALTLPEIREIYVQRHTLDKQIESSKSNPSLKAMMAADLAETKLSYQLADTQPLQLAMTAARCERPVLSPILQILPRTLDTPPHLALQACISLAARARSMGFGQVMIACVEPQTTELYYGQTDDGRLIESVNDHGYWCTGRPGIDPALGGDEEYLSMAESFRELKMVVVQDVAPGSLGYNDQFENETARRGVLTASELIYADYALEGEAASLLDERHIFDISRNRFTSPYRLPKPDLMQPKAFEAMFARLAWYAERAGVNRFRIDMAKHIPVAALRDFVSRLRSVVSEQGNSAEFGVILEYWSGDYRDLASAMHMLRANGGGVYFYDFPLAYLIRSILFDGKPFASAVRGLARERARFGIHLDWLVPFFIDHDEVFKPFYDGTEDAISAIVAGTALAVALSTNGPCMYVAFGEEDSHTAPRKEPRMNCRSRVSSNTDGDLTHVEALVRQILMTQAEFRDVLGDHAAPIGINGDDNNLTVLRCGAPNGSGMRMMKFVFARNPTDIPSASPEWIRKASYLGGSLSVAIDVYDRRFAKA